MRSFAGSESQSVSEAWGGILTARSPSGSALANVDANVDPLVGDYDVGS